jgi:hypothetical protein
MDQSRHRHVRIFTAWIGHVVRRSPGFLNPWNHLTPDRIFRIAMWHKIKKMRGDRERELVA